MERKSLSRMPCPIARSLERVGEWWSMLIMRDALHGYTRFDQLQQSLGIAPNMLTRRLNALVDAGLLARRRYSEHPPRDEYVPTARGVDFRPVLVALLAWGNRHFAPEGASVQIVNARNFAPLSNPLSSTARHADRLPNPISSSLPAQPHRQALAVVTPGARSTLSATHRYCRTQPVQANGVGDERRPPR